MLICRRVSNSSRLGQMDAPLNSPHHSLGDGESKKESAGQASDLSLEGRPKPHGYDAPAQRNGRQTSRWHQSVKVSKTDVNPVGDWKFCPYMPKMCPSNG